MKCKFPVQITEHKTARPEKTMRTITRLHLGCAYYSQASDKCECPYDECTMDYSISLKEEQ